MNFGAGLNDKLILGLRGNAKLIDGDAPFYAYPFIDMRGIKAMQYQGDKNYAGQSHPAGLWWALVVQARPIMMDLKVIQILSTARVWVYGT